MLLIFWPTLGANPAPRITLSLAPSASVTLQTTQATPSIRLKLVAVANPFATASPSIKLSLGPAAAATLGAASTPSIRLSLAPTAFKTVQAGSALGIVLALTPSLRLALVAQVAPRIRLALEAHAIGGDTPAGSTVVEMEYNAKGSTVSIDQRISVTHTDASTLTLSVRD